MANFAFTRGKKAILGDNQTTYGLLGLRETYTAVASPSHHTVADIVGYELTVAGYARATGLAGTVAEDDPNGRAILTLPGGSMTLGAAAAGQTLAWVVLFREYGSDATNNLICAFDVADIPTDGTALIVTAAAGGVARIV